MALTSTVKTDLYRFFAVAFDAAPGVTYMNQLAEAVNSGMTIPQIVEVFTTKTQFTSVYPTFFTNQQFATKLVNTVVGDSATSAAKAEAAADIVAALALGGEWTRGKVIYTIFNNLANKDAADATWGNTAKQMANQVAYAQYYTEEMLADSTDMATLRAVISNVTQTSSTDAAAIAAALTPAAAAQTFTLTAGADNRSGGNAADLFDGTSNISSTVTATLQSFDALNGGGGRDTLTLAQGDLADTIFSSVRSIESVITNRDVTLGSLAQAAGVDSISTSRADGTAGTLTLSAGYTNDAVSFSGLNSIVETVVLDNSAANTNYRVVVSSDEVGNGSATETGAVSSQDGGLAVRVQREDGSDGLTGGVARFEDEGLVLRSTTTGVAFDVRDINGTASGTFTGGVVLGTSVADTTFNNGAGASFGIAQNANVYVNGGAGNDSITSGSGNDFIYGGVGDDTLIAGDGNDTVMGGAGNDAITAGGGNDSINAGAGNDVVTVGDLSINDTLVGGDGVGDVLATVDDAITSTVVTNVSGFEIIRFTQTDGTAGTQAANALADITTIQVAITGTGATDDVTISNLGNTQIVSLRTATGTTNNDLTLTKLADSTADTATVVIGTGTAALTMGALTADSDETVNISSGATSTTASVITDLSIAAARTLNVTATGNALTIDVNGTGSNGNLSVINASASTANVNIFGTNGLDRAATVTGGSGNDTLAGSTSADNISGGAGNDVIAGLNGNDTLAGGTGNDSITSGTGNDVVTGGDGNDTIVGAGGTDNMDGGAGDDTFVFDTIADIGTTDTIVGGDGNDTLSSTGTTINLNSNAFAGVSGIENLSLGGGVTTVTINDTGLGSFGNAIRIVSATGSDHVIDASGVLSSASRVTYVGSTGAETYRLGNGIDSVSLGAGNDTVTVSTVALLGTSDVVGGGSGTGDAIRFTEVVGAATTLSAAQLATLSGFEVLDIDVAGTAGGNYVVNLTDSFLSANNNAGAFQVSRTGGGGDGTADTGTLSVNASTVSATYNITLIGADGNDSLVGGAGNDVIAGNGGTDTLTGGAGNDDFQVANNTTRDVITDFNFGTATATGAVDQIQILDAYLGGTNGADGSAGFQTGTNFGTVVLSADGATGVGSTTDVVVITGRSFNSITELDTVIETLNATNVTQDFFVIYQDGLGTVRVAIAESDGAEGGTDFTVTDAFQLTGVTVTGIASLVDVSDFIIV